MAKPVPSLQKTNPREFEIGQVVRRFIPLRNDDDKGNTTLKLKLHPSDPDFPFELAALECSVTVPASWPSGKENPVLRVENVEIERGYQINIERGFASLAKPGKTLLALLNDLDRNLESFLSSEKAQTVKIVANRGKRDASQPTTTPSLPLPVPVSEPIVQKKPVWTTQQETAAKVKRESDIRQLEARMGRLPLFSSTSSQSGTKFNVPVQVPKPGRLPVSIQSLKEVVLNVPLVYDLEPCTISLKGVAGTEADNIEHSFERHAKDHKELTLMAHINHLLQHMHEMAVVPVASPKPESDIPAPTDVIPLAVGSQVENLKDDSAEGVADEERPHLIFLARLPPEWNQPDTNEVDPETDSDQDEDLEESSDDVDDEESRGGASVPIPIVTPALEKGVLVSFPHLEMTGMELVELKNLSLSVRCDRCKDSLDMKNIKPAESTSGTSIQTVSCNKCASPLSASYRAEPMHMNSIKAGYLDLEGCSVLDMLPSNFVPTCSECSTTQPLPGISTVRGDTALSICRECHHKMTLRISEVKFLRVSLSDRRLHAPLPPKRKKEDLGITSGTELPLKGRCKHYSKSYRWFRFSCCNRVFPCDRCHDEAEEHPNEHANRMICGLCSREQNYRPEDCSFCGRSVIRKTGGGFWEGGKGTRDRVKMNRNDPRKHKRIGGTTAGEKKK